MLIVHPGDFGFQTKDIRVTGSAVTGPPSFSGIRQTLKTDGGGRVYVDLSDAQMIKRETIMTFGAITTEMDDGATPFLLMFCDRRYQPVNTRRYVRPDENYTTAINAGAVGTVNASAALRATTLAVNIASTLAVNGGEWVSIKHPNWGWRAYKILAGSTETLLRIRPPLREAVSIGTLIELDTPRCMMQLVGGNPSLSISGRYASGNLQLVEYMGKP